MVTLDPSIAGAAHAEDRLRRDEMIWITTVRADGQPQSSAVWFHWDGSDFLLVSQPAAAKVRNLVANPRVSLALNGTGYGADLVIVEGQAEVLPDYASGSWPEAARVEAYYAKYETALRESLGSSAAEMASAFSTALRITPTRWRVTP
jgi:PPOX class probable F420-dependent enzyme